MRSLKYRLLFLSFLFVTNSIAQSEWKWVQPQPTGGQMLELAAVDKELGYGLFTSSVLKTTNAGKSWSNLLNFGSARNSAIFVLNANEVWCANEASVLCSSTDGGKTWKNQTIKSLSTITKIQFFDSRNGVILGFRIKYEGTVRSLHYDLLKTVDGGKNWKPVTQNLPFSAEQFTAIDANTMWATGSSLNSGPGLWKSVDGGKTWNPVQEFQGFSVVQMHFSGNHGYVISKQPIDGGTLNETFIAGFTFDGGKTWDFDLNSFDYLAKNSGSVESVNFVDDLNGWMSTFMVESDRTVSELRATNDGGKTWKNLSKSDSVFYGYLGFFDKNTGLIVQSTWTSPPVLQHTADGGKTLNQITTGMNLNFNDFYFIDELTGFASNEVGLVKTTDGGASWYKVKTPDNLNFSYFKFFDLKNGVAGGAFKNEYGPGYGAGVVFATSDAGESWNLVADNNTPVIGTLMFLSPLVAYGIKGELDVQVAVKTTDGGKTWSELKTGKDEKESRLAMFFTDVNTGWLSGVKPSEDPEKPQNYSHFIRYTADGGKTWKEQLRKPGGPYDQQIFFSDSKNGCITLTESSTTVTFSYITNNGGKTWSPVNLKNEIRVNTLHFTDKNNGYIYATFPCFDCGSLIYATTDGGKTWKIKWELPVFGQKMFFHNAKTFWVGGGYKLMKYTGE